MDQLTDPTFGDDYPVDEIKKCIHIGMLCIQEEPANRPRMASIVAALNGECVPLPSPTVPLFVTGDTDNSIVRGTDQPALVLEVMENITELYPR